MLSLKTLILIKNLRYQNKSNIFQRILTIIHQCIDNLNILQTLQPTIRIPKTKIILKIVWNLRLIVKIQKLINHHLDWDKAKDHLIQDQDLQENISCIIQRVTANCLYNKKTYQVLSIKTEE